MKYLDHLFIDKLHFYLAREEFDYPNLDKMLTAYIARYWPDLSPVLFRHNKTHKSEATLPTVKSMKKLRGHKKSSKDLLNTLKKTTLHKYDFSSYGQSWLKVKKKEYGKMMPYKTNSFSSLKIMSNRKPSIENTRNIQGETDQNFNTGGKTNGWKVNLTVNMSEVNRLEMLQTLQLKGSNYPELQYNEHDIGEQIAEVSSYATSHHEEQRDEMFDRSMVYKTEPMDDKDPKQSNKELKKQNSKKIDELNRYDLYRKQKSTLPNIISLYK